LSSRRVSSEKLRKKKYRSVVLEVKRIKSFLMPAAVALWLSLLFLPFKGIKAASVLFLVLTVTIPVVKWLMTLLHKLPHPDRLTRFVTHDKRYLYVLLIPVFVVPFFAENYIVDVAVLAGIYIILALGLNVIVGYTGLLNLGFAAYYAIGAYGYALLSTRLGLGFWTALPVSVLLTTFAGFLLAVPAMRLKGDYLAIVTLGFGEIVRLVLNNWDSFTKGPNGVSGIAPPSLAGVAVVKISHYYYLVLFFVFLTFFIMRRVEHSKIGRAWIAIREDELAASAMGINTAGYKLYSNAFGAFWAGIAGCLFAAKMRFVSPESFTFMESVLIVCMVIVGGIGSIAGVIIGALVLVFLPEAMREAQMYRMLAVGSGLVFLMVFRPQGLFGRKSASPGS
jgi:branched-chain amino acid transport system permease protein